MIFFESKRLIYTDIEERDKQKIIDMNKNEKVMKYFPKLLTENESIQFYNRIKDSLINNKLGIYTVRLKKTRKIIGICGFNNAKFKADFTPCIEILWRFLPEFWGDGYATESSNACIKYAFDNNLIDTIYSFTAKINKRSEKVMMRSNMNKIGEFQHPALKKDHSLCNHVLYRIKK